MRFGAACALALALGAADAYSPCVTGSNCEGNEKCTNGLCIPGNSNGTAGLPGTDDTPDHVSASGDDNDIVNANDDKLWYASTSGDDAGSSATSAASASAAYTTLRQQPLPATSALKMRARARSLHEEIHGRVARYVTHAKAHLGESFAATIADTVTTVLPNHESTAYWAYPMTLDYVIDIAVATASDVVRDEHGHTVGYNYTEYPVIVDTGSSNLAMAVKGCSNCGVGASDLDAGLKSDMCIEVVYGSGSWSGYQTEALRVGFVEESASSSESSGLTTAASPVVENTTLAGITDQDDFFMGGGYNGILGLAYPALSEPYSSTFCSSSSSSSSSSSPSGVNGNSGGASSTSDGGDGSAHERVGDDFNEPTAIEDAATAAAALILDGAGPDSGGQGGALATSDVKRAAATPLLDAMFSDGALSADVFTIGFCSNEAVLAVGGVDPRGVVGGLDNITYVPAMKTYEMFWGYYLVYLESVEVDGEDIGADASTMNALGGVLVDSGTTLLYLPTSVVEVLEGKVAESVSLINGFFAWGACVSDDVLQAFPDISLNLKGGYTLELTPRDYTLHYGNCYYWGVAASSVGIIGNVALQNKLVVFDRAHNALGFGSAACGSGSGTGAAVGETAPLVKPSPEVDSAALKALRANGGGVHFDGFDAEDALAEADPRAKAQAQHMLSSVKQEQEHILGSDNIGPGWVDDSVNDGLPGYSDDKIPAPGPNPNYPNGGNGIGARSTSTNGIGALAAKPMEEQQHILGSDNIGPGWVDDSVNDGLPGYSDDKIPAPGPNPNYPNGGNGIGALSANDTMEESASILGSDNIGPGWVDDSVNDGLPGYSDDKIPAPGPNPNYPNGGNGIGALSANDTSSSAVMTTFSAEVGVAITEAHSASSVGPTTAILAGGALVALGALRARQRRRRGGRAGGLYDDIPAGDDDTYEPA